MLDKAMFLKLGDKLFLTDGSEPMDQSQSCIFELWDSGVDYEAAPDLLPHVLRDVINTGNEEFLMEAFLRTLQDIKRVSLECNLVKVGNFQSDARGLGPEPDLQNLHDPTKCDFKQTIANLLGQTDSFQYKSYALVRVVGQHALPIIELAE